jgi:hypothetical protein
MYAEMISALNQFPHCEKGLVVLAFRHKIQLLRTENPAVDTGTIYLPPIEFFFLQSPMAEKLWPENPGLVTTDTAGKSRPVTDRAGKSRQVTAVQIKPENPGQ